LSSIFLGFDFYKTGTKWHIKKTQIRLFGSSQTLEHEVFFLAGTEDIHLTLDPQLLLRYQAMELSSKMNMALN
jgi:hypothetical protein